MNNDKEFLLYLKNNHKHLYDFELEIRKVALDTGFGDVGVSCVVRNGKVFSLDIVGARKNLYKNLDNNASK